MLTNTLLVLSIHSLIHSLLYPHLPAVPESLLGAKKKTKFPTPTSSPPPPLYMISSYRKKETLKDLEKIMELKHSDINCKEHFDSHRMEKKCKHADQHVPSSSEE
jgi:hypothetical protein